MVDKETGFEHYLDGPVHEGITLRVEFQTGDIDVGNVGSNLGIEARMRGLI